MLRKSSIIGTRAKAKNKTSDYAIYIVLVAVICRVSVLNDVSPFGLSAIAALWTVTNPAALLIGGLIGMISFLSVFSL